MSGDPSATRVRVGSSEIVVRAADPDDRPRAREVQWAVGWKEAPSEHRTWPEADADWQARRYYREIVAEVDGIIAARVGLEAYRQPFAELIDLCVRPEYRRLGLGEMLTLEGQRESARRGFRALFLQTEMDNTAAHRLYTGLGFVPTAYGSMLRMVKLIDCPLLSDFKREHPLHRYTCVPGPANSRTWILQWDAYIRDDRLCLVLEGGASRSDSESCGPAIIGCDWRADKGERDLQLRFTPERVSDIEPGHHVETTVTVTNGGARTEQGAFQMVLPPEIKVAGPAANQETAFLWQAAPGETISQPVLLQVEPTFDASVLHELNYGSVPVSVEVYWEHRRILLNASLPFAQPKQSLS